MALPYAILAALINQPCSGYDLVKRFNQSVEWFWTASHQQIYKALAKLEDGEYVTSEKIEQENRPNKKLYTVTDSGRQHLQQWIGQAQADLSPIKSELLVKVSAGHMVPSDTLITTIEAAHQQHKSKLKDYQAVAKQFAQMPQLTREQQFQYIALRAGIRQQLAWIAWCEEAMAFLGQPVTLRDASRDTLKESGRDTYREESVNDARESAARESPSRESPSVN